jgi:hypothetical protein
MPPFPRTRVTSYFVEDDVADLEGFQACAPARVEGPGRRGDSSRREDPHSMELDTGERRGIRWRVEGYDGTFFPTARARHLGACTRHLA